MQRAVQLKSTSDEDYLSQISLTNQKPKPSPGPDEVLIRMKCRPVNPADIGTIKGRFRAYKPKEWPATPGFEGMGVVEAVGSGLKDMNVGQRVVPLIFEKGQLGEGTWQEYVTASPTDIVDIPDEVSDGCAAQFFANPWTVVGLLDDLAVPPGEFVLQTAAGSALGKEFVQYSKYKGIKTVNVIRRTEAVEQLKNLGADEVINSEEEDIVARVMAITNGRGVFAAIDAVGGKMTKTVCSCVRDGGTVLIYGALSGDEVVTAIYDLIFRKIVLRGFYMPHWVNSEHGTSEKRIVLAQKIMELMKKGVLIPPVGKSFDLAEFKEAILEAEKNPGKGKVLLVG